MTRILLVPSMRLENWKAMDRYSETLARELPASLPPDWVIDLHPQPRYPRWFRFGARWVAYPRTIDWEKFDVVHVLDHSYAHVLNRRNGHARTVLTVHDLFAFDPLGKKPGIRGAMLQRVNGWVLGGIRRADACLCDSGATMAAVVTRYPEMADRLHYHKLGVDSRFFVTDGAMRARGRELLGCTSGSEIALHVGSCVPRKNMRGLIEALALLAPARPALRLIQVGGQFSRDQLSLIESRNVASRIHQFGHVAEHDLPAVYAAADVVVVPSLFEGFGLPVLEAFAAGTPVVASRNGALAEFPVELLTPAGKGSAEELAAAISAVLNDLAGAGERAGRAREWAREHTWARTARAVADVYRSLLP